MTDDKDLKRLVRQRMARTGESYTTARAHFRPGRRAGGHRASIEDFRTLYERSDLDRLAAHLEGRYGIRVAKLAELDVGVFRVNRTDGPSWVARVFPAARGIEQVEGDAAILRFLADRGFRAERCAHDDAVSVLAGQGLLVTEHLSGWNARTDFTGPTLYALGETLGRLHALPGTRAVPAREAGAWHHISPNGGGRDADVEALLPLVAASEDRVPPQDREALAFVIDSLRAVDGCDELPAALTHPDPCGANAVVSTDGVPVLVDWSGAGQAPRVLSLGALLAGTLQPLPGTRPSADSRRIDAVIAGYRTHVRLTDGEEARLAPAIAGFGIVLDCWSLLFHDVPARDVARAVADRLAMSERAAERAVRAFDADDAEFTGWYTASRPAVHPGQEALF